MHTLKGRWYRKFRRDGIIHTFNSHLGKLRAVFGYRVALGRLGLGVMLITRETKGSY
jgi:hypothetical protein